MDTCKHCGKVIHQEMFEGHSFWVDDATGGDVCGWNGGNEPHEPAVTALEVGQRVRIREQYRREGDFEVAVVHEIDAADNTIDVSVDGRDWGQWFCRLPDGTYEIEPVPDSEET